MKCFRNITATVMAGMLILPHASMQTGAEAGMQGDVNVDGKFSVADVVLFQKWLLAVPGVSLADWETADFNNDGVVDVFDLCLMKRALLETFDTNARKMTIDEFIELARKGDGLTWEDFAPYQGQDIGTGWYEVRYESTDDDEFYLLVCGESMEGRPDNILLMAVDGNVEVIDIRSEEFQRIINWKEPEDDETTREAARKIGEHALEKIQQGDYAPGDETSASEFMTEDMADIERSMFTYLRFIDAHTVLLQMNRGLLDVHGYLITDGTVTYREGEEVPVPSYMQYDGDVIWIDWAGDNLYYFTAGT